MRLLDGNRKKDKRSVRDMLVKFVMLSINQTAAQIKLQDARKASSDNEYPINLKRNNQRGGVEPARNTRLPSQKMMTEGGKNKSSGKKLCKRYRKALEPGTNIYKRCTIIDANIKE